MTTDNKTLAVDVLAAMQELEDELQSAANYSGEGCYWSRDDDDLLRRSAEARAAVAELIEAAQDVENICVRHDANDADLFRRLDAALARIKEECA